MKSRFADIANQLTPPTTEQIAIEAVTPQDSTIAAIKPEEPKELAKSKDPAYHRTTVYLPKALMKKIRVACAEQDQEMDISDLLAKAAEAWLDARKL